MIEPSSDGDATNAELTRDYSADGDASNAQLPRDYSAAGDASNEQLSRDYSAVGDASNAKLSKDHSAVGDASNAELTRDYSAEGDATNAELHRASSDDGDVTSADLQRESFRETSSASSDTHDVESRNSWQEATIERIEVETPGVKTFVLRPKTFHEFLPGQHIDVRLTAPDGYEAHRSYSISSAPDDSGTFQLAIEILKRGEVSPYFHEVAVTGDIIEVRGPFTVHFVWRPATDGSVLLVGGGSGVAPLMSMLRHRARVTDAAPMTLLYSARSWDDVIFRDELLQQEQTQTGLRVLFCITRDLSNAPPSRSGDFTHRIDEAIVREVISQMPERPQTCFVCGNNGFVGTVADALVDAGIPAHRVKTERYGGN